MMKEEFSFGIFSVKFSTGGREVIAESSDDFIYVFDLEANKPSLRILAHTVLYLLIKTFYGSLDLICIWLFYDQVLFHIDIKIMLFHSGFS